MLVEMRLLPESQDWADIKIREDVRPGRQTCNLTNEALKNVCSTGEPAPVLII